MQEINNNSYLKDQKGEQYPIVFALIFFNNPAYYNYLNKIYLFNNVRDIRNIINLKCLFSFFITKIIIS